MEKIKLKSHLIYLWQLYCWFCLLVIYVSYSSIIVKFLYGAYPQHHGAANRQRKLTVTKFIQNVYRILTWVPYVPSDVITYFQLYISSRIFENVIVKCTFSVQQFFRPKPVSKVAHYKKVRVQPLLFFPPSPFLLFTLSFSPFLFLRYCDFGASRA